MEPWYKVVTPREEVREGRSFDPSEFAIALEQVVAGTAPEDYRDPVKFFDRTCFTRALTEHMGLALRRLRGDTQNTAPVMALITQFGGGKTHTLAALYHLINGRKRVADHEGVKSFLKEAGLSEIPSAKVAVFVGNAWDPSEGNETPWIDIARQLAGDEGVAALGPEAKSKAPGTDNLRKLFSVAGGRALVLCDEVLNFLSRHRDRAESFRDFLANIVRAMTGAEGCACVVSLPQSKPEMSDWDMRWQDVIVKEVGRVAKQLIANDETEISEVVRLRLFEDLGSDRVRKNVARAYANWCFERRAQLPSEWTAVDTATTETKAKEHLRERFESCYPFHPATLSVFQRKWQSLPQYQQTRGTLAMFAQWISWAYAESFREARTEPLLTLGSAPLHVAEFRGVVLTQLGEPRLSVGIDVDIAGTQSHARALDADSKGALRDIHRRVGTAILFESSGGMVDKTAHLPELRFALGEPEVDTTSVDNAALSLETKAFYLRKVGTDGFQIRSTPTIKKVVNDRLAALGDAAVKKTMESITRDEFKKGASVPLAFFPEDGAAVSDSPKLTIVVLEPSTEWTGEENVRKTIADWTKQRGGSPRLYPASLVWCVKKPGRELQSKVELCLAWNRVQNEVNSGALGDEFDKKDLSEIGVSARDAQEDARDEVWASYRYVLLADPGADDGVKVIDLGAGHASGTETLCGRIISALKSNGLLNEFVGAGYIERNWPPALKDSGAWPLSSLRKSFVDGSLTRLLDPESVLRTKIPEFVAGGSLGLASGAQDGKSFTRVWFKEMMSPDEVDFEPDVYLLTKSKASQLKEPTEEETTTEQGEEEASEGFEEGEGPQPSPTATVRIRGSIPPEVWNVLGRKVIPKLKAGKDMKVGIELSAVFDGQVASQIAQELRQALKELGLSNEVEVLGG